MVFACAHSELAEQAHSTDLDTAQVSLRFTAGTHIMMRMFRNPNLAEQARAQINFRRRQVHATVIRHAQRMFRNPNLEEQARNQINFRRKQIHDTEIRSRRTNLDDVTHQTQFK